MIWFVNMFAWGRVIVWGEKLWAAPKSFKSKRFEVFDHSQMPVVFALSETKSLLRNSGKFTLFTSLWYPVSYSVKCFLHCNIAAISDMKSVWPAVKKGSDNLHKKLQFFKGRHLKKKPVFPLFVFWNHPICPRSHFLRESFCPFSQLSSALRREKMTHGLEGNGSAVAQTELQCVPRSYLTEPIITVIVEMKAQFSAAY